MDVVIITIGDEILIGQIVDTNSAWMAVELNAIGCNVVRIVSISDDEDVISKSIDEAFAEADVVLITGGLGATNDDKTKKTLARYFNSKMVIHQPTAERIQNMFKQRGVDIPLKLNEEQALIPECCQALENRVGTAPGMAFVRDGKLLISMPGVPFEMKGLMTDCVLPMLKEKSGNIAIVHKTILTTTIPETLLAQKIEAWENSLPEYIKLAYLPSPGEVKLRLSAIGSNEDELKREIDELVGRLNDIIGEAVYGYDNDTMAGVIGRLLEENGLTMSSAESCTGGNISHLITLTPGSSNWYKGTVVSYSNEVKNAVLGVPSQLLDVYGAVSSEVVEKMAEGAVKLLNTDYAVATSGVAGPDGGTKEKPVGLVWIAVSGPNGTKSREFRFGSNRERNIEMASIAALNMLRCELCRK